MPNKMQKRAAQRECMRSDQNADHSNVAVKESTDVHGAELHFYCRYQI